MKRGISGTVSTILVIVIIIAIAAIAVIWTNGYLSRTQKSATLTKVCSGLNFVASSFCYKEGQTIPTDGSAPQTTDMLVFSVENRMSSAIDGFLLSLQYSSGKSVPLSIPDNGQIESGQVKVITTDFIPTTNGLNQIEIKPEVTINNVTSVCDSNSQSVQANSISICAS